MPENKPLHLEMQEAWGETIREARGPRTQAWLGRRIGFDQATVSRIEAGTYKLTAELMLSIAAALDVELGVLFKYPRGYVEIERSRRAASWAQAEAAAAKPKAVAS